MDLLCREVVHADFEQLKKTPNRNVFLGSHIINGEIVLDESEEEDRMGKRGRVDEVFGEPLSFPAYLDASLNILILLGAVHSD